MKHFLLLYFIIILVDSVYLYTMKTPFVKMIESIQNKNIKLRLYSIILCYLIVCTCIYNFLWKNKASYKEAFLLGCIIYGVFDTTNYALFRNWDITLSIVDTMWGGVLFSSSLFLMNQISSH